MASTLKWLPIKSYMISFSRCHFPLGDRKPNLHQLRNSGSAGKQDRQSRESDDQRPETARLDADVGRKDRAAVGADAGPHDDGTHYADQRRLGTLSRERGAQPAREGGEDVRRVDPDVDEKRFHGCIVPPVVAASALA